MFVTAATVYAVTPDGGFGRTEAASNQAPSSSESESAATSSDEPTETNPALFVEEKAVRVDARLGHHVTSSTTGVETYVMIELKGSDDAVLAENNHVHLGLVIDKSGSMRGKRFDNAKASARAAIDRLVDGDTVSLVTFNTKTETVVPPTRVDPASREAFKRSVDALVVGGDTCISCGIEAASSLMGGTPGITRRMIVLSDGEPTAGVRDLEGMRSVARVARNGGITVSGIGVDLQYNEGIMAAVAEGGEGQHRFVAEPRDLSRVFESEAASLRQTVAENLEAHIVLEPGVELVEVLDRPFTRAGSDLVVSLGSLTKGEVKTVLARVRVPAAVRGERLEVARISVKFSDLTKGKAGALTESVGSLAAKSATKQGAADPFVLARIERSATARALDDANQLFRSGQVDAARARLESRLQSLKKTTEPLPTNDPFAGARTGDARKDVDKQLGILGRAKNGFATPPPPKPSPGAPAVASPSLSNPFESNARQNKEDAFQNQR